MFRPVPSCLVPSCLRTKQYLNDPYPLPQIDLLVYSTYGNQLLNFLDAYSSYSQITMYEPDKEKTAFVIEQGTYYQRLVNMMFKKQIGVTIEVYVDDIMVKGK
ncbi:hypothetical protein FF2_038104 [Malus domestica]